MREQVLVWAHRGASGYAPENTMEAFRKAVDMEADGVELDVQMTKDGELVVIHDETIDRVCEGSGWVKDFTFEELRQYNFNKAFPETEHADIPTLREVLELMRPTGMTVNIEFKTGEIFYEDIEQKTIDLVKELGMQDQVIYSSFNHYSVMKVKEILPAAKVGLLYSDGIFKAPRYAYRLGASALHPAAYNLQYPHYMERCRKYGLEVNVWTVNDPKQMQKMCRYGVHAIITNYPDLGKKTVTKYWSEHKHA